MPLNSVGNLSAIVDFFPLYFVFFYLEVSNICFVFNFIMIDQCNGHVLV